MVNSMNIVAYDGNSNEVRPSKVNKEFESSYYKNNNSHYYEWENQDNPSAEYDANLEYSKKLQQVMQDAKGKTLALNLIKVDEGLVANIKENIQSNEFPTFGGEKSTKDQFVNI